MEALPRKLYRTKTPDSETLVQTTFYAVTNPNKASVHLRPIPIGIFRERNSVTKVAKSWKEELNDV